MSNKTDVAPLLSADIGPSALLLWPWLKWLFVIVPEEWNDDQVMKEGAIVSTDECILASRGKTSTTWYGLLTLCLFFWQRSSVQKASDNVEVEKCFWKHNILSRFLNLLARIWWNWSLFRVKISFLLPWLLHFIPLRFIDKKGEVFIMWSSLKNTNDDQVMKEGVHCIYWRMYPWFPRYNFYHLIWVIDASACFLAASDNEVGRGFLFFFCKHNILSKFLKLLARIWGIESLFTVNISFYCYVWGELWAQSALFERNVWYYIVCFLLGLSIPKPGH